MFVRRIFPWMEKWKRGPSRGRGVYRSAVDMTEYDRIREMVHWGDTILDQGAKSLVLDLERLEKMDSSLVAGIILLCRRAKNRGATVRLVCFPKHFETMLDIYRVRRPLEEAGCLFEGSVDVDPEVATRSVKLGRGKAGVRVN